VNLGTTASAITDARWYREEHEGDRHAYVMAVVKRILASQQSWQEELKIFGELYSRNFLASLGARGYRRRSFSTQGRLALNVVKSCSDSYTAKLTQQRPKVTFVTSGGDWALQEKAKKLDTFIEGQFYETDLYELAPLIVLDTAVFGTGFVQLYASGADEDEKIAVDRVLPWELVADDAEAYYGDPPSLYRYKVYDRTKLLEEYPEAREEILACKNEPMTLDDYSYETTADQIYVVEAWHLPSSAKAQDGRHCIVIDNATLVDEEYTRDYFPFARLVRQKPLYGIWGTGIAQELRGIQREINVLLQKIQQAHHLLGAGHWLVENGSKVNPNSINNIIGSIIRWSGTPPQLVTGTAVNPEIYQHLWALYEKAFEICGISQLAAQAQKPAGLNSGKALRVFANIESERFSVAEHEYQHWFLGIARQMIDLAKEISDRNPKFSVRATSRNVMREIRWRDVHLREDEYVLKLYPTNAFADEPAARMQQVQEAANVGWIDASHAKRLLDFPDLEAARSFEDASYDLTMSLIEEMKEGRYIGPEPFMNLAESVKVVQLAYLKLKRDGLPEDRLELLRRWMSEGDRMEKEAAARASLADTSGYRGPPPPPAPGGPPMAPPPAVPAPPEAEAA
jgi:hypothetical protein